MFLVVYKTILKRIRFVCNLFNKRRKKASRAKSNSDAEVFVYNGKKYAGKAAVKSLQQKLEVDDL
ncbi:MAG: hypothetical protein ABIU63_08535 [Chitinophagaceae bacterium]